MRSGGIKKRKLRQLRGQRGHDLVQNLRSYPISAMRSEHCWAARLLDQDPALLFFQIAEFPHLPLLPRLFPVCPLAAKAGRLPPSLREWCEVSTWGINDYRGLTRLVAAPLPPTPLHRDARGHVPLPRPSMSIHPRPFLFTRP